MDNILDRIRAARSAEQVAQELEPLTVALATIADDFRQATAQASEQAQTSAQEAAKAQTGAAAEWLKAQEKAASSWTAAAQKALDAARATQEASGRVKAMLRASMLQAAFTACLAGLIAGAVVTGYWIWRPPVQVLSPQINLDPARVVELLKEAGWQAPSGTKPRRQ